MTSRNAQAPSPIATEKVQKTKDKPRRSFKSFFVRSQPLTPPESPLLLAAPHSRVDDVREFTSERKQDVERNPHIPTLPREVVNKIAQFVSQGHILGIEGDLPSVCDTCYMRDLCSLALVTRKWLRAVQQILYVRIYIHGSDSAAQLKPRFGSKSTNAYGSRIKLLRRSLRSNPDLAALVRELKVPAYDLSLPRSEIASIHSLVASVITACPNFEKLVGFYPVYEFGCGVDDDGQDDKWGGGDRLWQALSTRKCLKEHVWLLSGDNVRRPMSRQASRSAVSLHQRPITAHGLAQTHSDRFMDYHSQWSSLQTLVLHGLDSNLSLTPDQFSNLFEGLPLLKSLYVSHFGRGQFSNSALYDVPPLVTCLRLESLPGITNKGLSIYFSSRSLQIRKLSLINLEVPSLLLIIKVFTNLPHLRKFTFLQTISPILPDREMIYLHPLLANKSLRFLHWDCLRSGDADRYLAASIAEGGFPSLVRLRAPSDETGVLQSMCRPRGRIDLPDDKFRALVVKQTLQRSKFQGSTYSLPTFDFPSLPSSPNPSSPSSSSILHEHTRHLPTTRLMAQRRLEMAKDGGNTRTLIEKMETRIKPILPYPSFQLRIIITDCDSPAKTGAKQDIFVHSYIGKLGSQVEYYLLPDLPGSETAIIGMGDIIDCGWEWKDIPGSEGCTGLWNREENVYNHQATKYLWHRERVAWKKLSLDVLF